MWCFYSYDSSPIQIDIVGRAGCHNWSGHVDASKVNIPINGIYM